MNKVSWSGVAMWLVVVLMLFGLMMGIAKFVSEQRGHLYTVTVVRDGEVLFNETGNYRLDQGNDNLVTVYKRSSGGEVLVYRVVAEGVVATQVLTE